MNKINQFLDNKQWLHLSEKNQKTIEALDESYPLSVQDIRQLIEIARDLEMWDENPLALFVTEDHDMTHTPKQRKEFLTTTLKTKWNQLKSEATKYDDFKPSSDFKAPTLDFKEEKERTILGDCPVASEKTRCCNLKTLDVVENCGFDCSYCTIQSFYSDGKVNFEKNLAEKLAMLDLDPNKEYHIGTGQSSDSLMWGNHNDTLETLMQFAADNSNVLLELKTKSNNIQWMLDNPIPHNVICTWSLNPQTIVDNEEHLTATLEQRLAAARTIADKGIAVGFHFHPMVYFEGWQEAYGDLFDRLMQLFDSQEVILVSLGTLTFIKPVLKKLRNRDFKSKILQMPLEDASGKYSYPYNIKKEMFHFAYEKFTPWHDKVFFYMCMEDKSLWNEVFGYEYATNDEFEQTMIRAYKKKIEQLKK